ncbi:unnamed protein product [Parnassius apollo]|uniref:(apollo) hypothetical protein n=1 Tax=Parnassius apollo TaxID=110799 RepID=A0A8S3WN94_PARAO|nr:unnamed protein product [Parnassius apollo]
MATFHKRIASLEKEKNSIAEVLSALNGTIESLNQRIEQNFIPLKVRELFQKHNITAADQTQINNEIKQMYEECINYINLWITPLQSVKCYEWMCLKKDLQFEKITDALVFLRDKGIPVDDAKLFEEFCLLKNFLTTKQSDFYDELAEKQWCIFLIQLTTAQEFQNF